MSAAVTVHRELQGKELVATKRVGPIPKGTKVYCFHDTGDWFHIVTPRRFLGVSEFKLAATHRIAFDDLNGSSIAQPM